MKNGISIFFAFLFFPIMYGCADDNNINGIDIDTNGINVNDNGFHYEAEIFAVIPNLGSYAGHSFQGFAVHGDIAFGFYDTGLCRCIDLNKKEIIAEFALPEGVRHNNNHAGVACFSNEFLSENDEFPLLYLSSYKERKCYVLNMTPTNATLVQTIMTVDSLNDNKVQDVWAYEPDGEILLLKMTSKTEYNWVSVKRPSVISGKEVYIDINNSIDTFSVKSSATYNAGFALNGKIYQLAGYTKPSRKLYILDYVNKSIIADITWNSHIINDQEQEQCSKYRDGILINYNYSDKLVYVKFNNWSF